MLVFSCDVLIKFTSDTFLINCRSFLRGLSTVINETLLKIDAFYMLSMFFVHKIILENTFMIMMNVLRSMWMML